MAESKLAPEPLSRWLMVAAQSTGAVVAGGTKAAVAAEAGQSLAPFCKGVESRFPFRRDLAAPALALMGAEQVALFYLPSENPQVYALGNRDPIGKANVLSRGILGDVQGQLVVASPLYKQHFSLETGACLEEEGVQVEVYPVRLEGDSVLIGRR